MNFIKKVFQGEADESAHRQFIRFGKGDYKKRAVVGWWKTKNLKIKSSFEFANDLVLFAANLGEVNFSGDIWSRDELEGLSGKKKSGKWVYDVQDMTSSEVKDLADKAYYFLLDGEGEGIKLKIKKKLPKPGKSEKKVDVRFCLLELDKKYASKVMEDFFWDIPEGKKISVKHNFIITEIVMPKTDETDFAKIRELAKRKGRIIREADVDGKIITSEKDFEA